MEWGTGSRTICLTSEVLLADPVTDRRTNLDGDTTGFSMNFDPQKFFIGLMDFFSILLPGALFTYMLMGEIGPVALGARYGKIQNTEAWAVFLAGSYLFGHLIFLAGSWLDELYDWIRGYTLNK